MIDYAGNLGIGNPLGANNEDGNEAPEDKFQQRINTSNAKFTARYGPLTQLDLVRVNVGSLADENWRMRQAMQQINKYPLRDVGNTAEGLAWAVRKSQSFEQFQKTIPFRPLTLKDPRIHIFPVGDIPDLTEILKYLRGFLGWRILVRDERINVKLLRGHYTKKMVDGYGLLQSLLEISSGSCVCTIVLLAREMSGNLPRDNEGSGFTDLARQTHAGYMSSYTPSNSLSPLRSRGYFGQGGGSAASVHMQMGMGSGGFQTSSVSPNITFGTTVSGLGGGATEIRRGHGIHSLYSQRHRAAVFSVARTSTKRFEEQRLLDFETIVKVLCREVMFLTGFGLCFLSECLLNPSQEEEETASRSVEDVTSPRAKYGGGETNTIRDLVEKLSGKYTQSTLEMQKQLAMENAQKAKSGSVSPASDKKKPVSPTSGTNRGVPAAYAQKAQNQAAAAAATKGSSKESNLQKKDDVDTALSDVSSDEDGAAAAKGTVNTPRKRTSRRSSSEAQATALAVGIGKSPETDAAEKTSTPSKDKPDASSPSQANAVKREDSADSNNLNDDTMTNTEIANLNSQLSPQQTPRKKQNRWAQNGALPSTKAESYINVDNEGRIVPHAAIGMQQHTPRRTNQAMVALTAAMRNSGSSPPLKSTAHHGFTVIDNATNLPMRICPVCVRKIHFLQQSDALDRVMRVPNLLANSFPNEALFMLSRGLEAGCPTHNRSQAHATINVVDSIDYFEKPEQTFDGDDPEITKDTILTLTRWKESVREASGKASLK